MTRSSRAGTPTRSKLRRPAAAAWSASTCLPLWVADMDFRVPDCVDGSPAAPGGSRDLRLSPEDPEVHPGHRGLVCRRHRYTVGPRRHPLQSRRGARHQPPGAGPDSHGDGIILQPPGVPLFWAVRTNERRILENRLAVERGGAVLASTSTTWSRKAREARLLILCNPHNPVAGASWRREELERIAEICLRRKVDHPPRTRSTTTWSSAPHRFACRSPALSAEVDRITVTTPRREPAPSTSRASRRRTW
ncbi:MAG: hypothetical protein MZV49_00200 [Rhodopseudomonas palustris]|nr:hypothetical protein [Rhodopseudomonas palustris]